MCWHPPTVPPAVSDRLQRDFNLHPVFARLLAARGWHDSEALARFLSPDLDQLHSPWTMLGMPSAVDRIQRAIASRESITLYGDYDVDGTTAVVLLRKALQMLGADPAWYVPHRLQEGYGLHQEAVEHLGNRGTRLIITVDTGIRALETVRRAAELGIDVIITDHHLPGAELPAAAAILNPHQPGCPYPDKNLCGAAVAFKLAQALFERSGRLQPGAWPRWLTAFLKLLAIGTIADSVPLLGENRVITHFGLKGLEEPSNPGLHALLQTALPGRRQVSADDVAFRLAPRLNAAGRMDSAAAVINLFSATAAEAGPRALHLDQLNQQRRATVDDILAQAEAALAADPSLLDSAILVLDGDGWHRGVLGIVASRLLDRHGLPTLVISRDGHSAHGSGRSAHGLHLLHCLQPSSDLFDRFGGHAQAVGFSLPASRIPELRQRLRDATSLVSPPAPSAASPDLEIRLGEIDRLLVDHLERLEPCGQSNPTPRFLARGVTTIGPPRLLKDRHLKLQLEQDGHGFEALLWNACGPAGSARPGLPPEAISPGCSLDILFRIEFTRHPQFGDRIQLILADYRPSSAPAGADRAVSSAS